MHNLLEMFYTEFIDTLFDETVSAVYFLSAVIFFNFNFYGMCLLLSTAVEKYFVLQYIHLFKSGTVRMNKQIESKNNENMQFFAVDVASVYI